MKPLWDRPDVNALGVYREFRVTLPFWERVKLLFKGRVWVEIVETNPNDDCTNSVWPTVCRLTSFGKGFETPPERPKAKELWKPYPETALQWPSSETGNTKIRGEARYFVRFQEWQKHKRVEQFLKQVDSEKMPPSFHNGYEKDDKR